ncbi:endonuclease/exonuclease/phosphatase family protein [Vibrio splendidus]|uniref:endonuclease/exonuclease/phosphatase family protein n=1 Tax=Vibrio splendidus TaxID=29497 RepID=UPI000C861878|nr:endonuclease/exonuclease/phosphatase family protein [Vibrio splendidus]
MYNRKLSDFHIMYFYIMQNSDLIRLYNLRFAWWNIGISPAAASKSDMVDFDNLTTELLALFTVHRASLLAICEVSSSDVKEIAQRLSSPYKILDLTFKTGRTRFDTAIIYDSKKINVSHLKDLTSKIQGRTIKAAQKIKVIELKDGDEFVLYLCHWPSRLRGDGEAKRLRAADILYLDSSEEMSNGKLAIIMGDFNDNPYDVSIQNNLCALRCHDATRKYPMEIFYNPFWRKLVSKSNYNHLSGKQNKFHSGSHYYVSASQSNWHMFDQIMVSGGFLGSTKWHLQESETGVIDNGQYLTNILDNGSIYDHLPVICEITKPEVNNV